MLHSPEFLQQLTTNACKNAIAVIQSADHKSIYKFLGGLLCRNFFSTGGLMAIIIPLLKKTGANVEDEKNDRPVSNLTFMSKLVDRAVARRLMSYLSLHGLMPQLQSAYRQHHSTETTLLRE